MGDFASLAELLPPVEGEPGLRVLGSVDDVTTIDASGIVAAAGGRRVAVVGIEDVVVIDLKGKSAFADYMVIASGRSNRQVVAIADHLAEKLKQNGYGHAPVEGKQGGDWVLVDAGDVVVHVFRPEPRAFYALEKMWALENEAAAKPVKAKPVKKVATKRATTAKPAARRKRAS